MARQKESQKRLNPDRIKLAIAVLFLAVAGVIAWRQLAADGAVDFASNRGFKCSDCQYAFAHTIVAGEYEPIVCPKCGKTAAYAAEKCYWMSDGNGGWIAKTEPTLVLLKSHIDPDSTEKTVCPDCGHEVVGHNPTPSQELMDAARAAGR